MVFIEDPRREEVKPSIRADPLRQGWVDGLVGGLMGGLGGLDGMGWMGTRRVLLKQRTTTLGSVGKKGIMYPFMHSMRKPGILMASLHSIKYARGEDVRC